jgi:hypothetical protein
MQSNSSEDNDGTFADDSDRVVNFKLATYKYSRDEQEAIRRRISSGFSNEEWARLAHFAKCQEADLRFELNKLHKFYWDNRIDEWIPTRIGEKVHALLKRTQELKRDLKQVTNDENFYKGVFLEHNRSPAEYARELEQSFSALSQMESVLWDAHVRLEDPDSQPTYGPITAAIRHIDFVAHRHYIGGISFSKKHPFGVNFIVELFRLIDGKVKATYIESLLKEYLKKRAQWGGIDELLKQERN